MKFNSDVLSPGNPGLANLVRSCKLWRRDFFLWEEERSPKPMRAQFGEEENNGGSNRETASWPQKHDAYSLNPLWAEEETPDRKSRRLGSGEVRLEATALHFTGNQTKRLSIWERRDVFDNCCVSLFSLLCFLLKSIAELYESMSNDIAGTSELHLHCFFLLHANIQRGCCCNPSENWKLWISCRC